MRQIRERTREPARDYILQTKVNSEQAKAQNWILPQISSDIHCLPRKSVVDNDLKSRKNITRWKQCQRKILIFKKKLGTRREILNP